MAMLPLLHINAIWSKVRSYSVNVQWRENLRPAFSMLTYRTLMLDDLKLDN